MRGDRIRATRKRGRGRGRSRSPLAEQLESRRLLATYTVNSAAEYALPFAMGLGDAINAANSHQGPDTIAFDIPPGGGQTIVLTSALPTITDPVSIDGSTQPGFSSPPIIGISGTQLSAGDGLSILASNTSIQSLAIFGFSKGDGIKITASKVNVQGCNIGVDQSNASAVANKIGIEIVGGQNNVIGGTGSLSPNMISGNSTNGILIDSNASNNAVLGNFIGTDNTGLIAIANGGIGVYVKGTKNRIGGDQAGQGNVISGNGGNGIQLEGFFSSGNNLIEGNKIGVSSDASQPLGNKGAGIFLFVSDSNTIGGTTSGALNVIGGNGPLSDGIMTQDSKYNLIQGNYIGTNPDGATNLGNSGDGIFIFGNGSGTTIGGTLSGAGNVIAYNGTPDPFFKNVGVRLSSSSVNVPILSNSIYGNVGIGIDLNGDGVTLNDNQDLDTGANNLQNFPVITSAATAAGRTQIIGSLNSTPNGTFLLQFFSSPASLADSTGYGQGKTLLGFTTVTTDGSGNASFSVTLAKPSSVGDIVSATATTSPTASGNTSEFAQDVTITQGKVSDLSVTLTDNPDPATTDNTVTYTATVLNSGSSDATNVQFNQTLPGGLFPDLVNDPTSLTSSQGTVLISNGAIVGNLGTIPVGQSVTVTLKVTPTTAGTISTTASVQGDHIDINTTNNSATQSTTVFIPSDLAVTITPVSNPAIEGQKTAFVALITNNGPGLATGVTFDAPLPANTTFVGAFPGQGTAGISGSSIHADLGTMAKGVTVAVRIVLIPNTTGTLSLSGSLGFDEIDLDPSNNSATGTVAVVPNSDLSITLAADQSTVLTGQNLTFQSQVANIGPNPADHVIVTFQVPANSTFVSASPSQGGAPTVSPDGSTVTINLGTLASGGQAQIQYLIVPQSSGTLTPTVSVASDSGDTVLTNNQASASVLVDPTDLSVSQTALPTPAEIGHNLTYKLSVLNSGPADATGVTVYDQLPTSVQFVSGTVAGSGGSVVYDSTTSIATITVGSVPSGVSVPVSLVVVPTSSTTLTNTAVGLGRPDRPGPDQQLLDPVHPCQPGRYLRRALGHARLRTRR